MWLHALKLNQQAARAEGDSYDANASEELVRKAKLAKLARL